MFSGLQPIKFGFDQCPKKQNDATSNLEISSIQITRKRETNALIIFPSSGVYGSGAGVGVGMLRGGGDSKIIQDLLPIFKIYKISIPRLSKIY